jgi:hypothetical protein
VAVPDPSRGRLNKGPTRLPQKAVLVRFPG